MRQLVCIDLWNTLIHAREGDGNSYYHVLLRMGVDPNDMHQTVRQTCMTNCLTYPSMVRACCKCLGAQPSNQDVKDVCAAWRHDNRDIVWMDGAQDTLVRLRDAGHYLVLVTNTTWPGWVDADRALSVRRYFDQLFLSCVEGIAKPDPRVWQFVDRNAPQERAASWMIGDDPEDDLAIPARLGWRTIRIDGNVTIADIPRRMQGERT